MSEDAVKIDRTRPARLSTAPTRGPRVGKWVAIQFVITATAVGMMFVSPSFHLQAASWYGLAVASTSLITVGRVVSGGFWSIPQMSLLTLIIFHCGALIEFVHTDQSAFVTASRLRAMTEGIDAIFIASAGVACFALGVCAARGADGPTPPRSTGNMALAYRASVADVGAVVSVLGCVMWFRFARSAGLGFGSSYGEYLTAIDGTAVASFYYLIALGLPMSMVDYRRTLSRFAIVAFACFAVVGFPLGLRGEVLFTAAVALCVVATQRDLPRWKPSVAVFLLLLVPIAVVSQTRQAPSDRESANVSADPLRGIYEMGGTLYVVAASVRWHDTQAMPHLNGRTYAAPIRDSFGRFILRDLDYDPSSDLDYMSTQVISRIGFFGGSVIAEAFVNFGRGGVVWVLGLWGAMLAWLSRRAAGSVSRLGFAITAAVVFQALVRNSFEAAPVLILYATVVLALAGLTGLARGSGNAVPTADDVL